MKKLLFNKKLTGVGRFLPLILMVLLSSHTLWGQITFEKSPNTFLNASRSITRDWKGTAQIVYIDALNDYEDEVRLGASTQAQIIYAEYNSSTMKKVSVTPGGDYIRVSDMKILEDTLYFCGYRRDIGDTNSHGFIGYFSIPDAFSGRDSVHILWFNNNRTGRYAGDDGTAEFTESGDFCLNRPKRIEVFKVDKGIHIICVGQWGVDNSFMGSRSCFVADIVRSFDHRYRSNPWWYYVCLGNGMEAFSDIAVTDNYIATAANKVSEASVYMRLFNRPRAVEMLTTGEDPQMFQADDYGRRMYHYLYMWRIDGSSRYKYQRIIHTDGDSIALALHTLSTANRPNDFGITVNHLAVRDMLETANPGFINGAIPIDGSGFDGGYVNPGSGGDEGPYEDIEGPDPIGGGGGLAPIDPNIQTGFVPISYSRKINQNLLDVPATNNQRLQDIAYDREGHRLLVLDYNDYYTFTPEWSMMGVHAFTINDTNAPVFRYSPMQEPRTLRSLDMYNHQPFFIYSGYEDNQSPYVLTANYNLTFGMTDLNDPFNCFDREEVPTFDPKAACQSEVSPYIQSFRVDPIKRIGSVDYTAFSYQAFALTVENINNMYNCK